MTGPARRPVIALACALAAAGTIAVMVLTIALDGPLWLVFAGAGVLLAVANLPFLRAEVEARRRRRERPPGNDGGPRTP